MFLCPSLRHICGLMFQVGKPKLAMKPRYLERVYMFFVSMKKRQLVQFLLLFTSLWNSTFFISTQCYWVSRAPDSVYWDSFTLSFRDSFDAFLAQFLCLFHTLCSESSGRFCFLGKMLSSGTHRFTQFSWCPLLFCLVFFSRLTSLRVRISWCLVVLMTPSLVLQQGASQKRRPKVAIDLFVPFFSVLHCWSLCHCQCSLKWTDSGKIHGIF